MPINLLVRKVSQSGKLPRKASWLLMDPLVIVLLYFTTGLIGISWLSYCAFSKNFSASNFICHSFFVFSRQSKHEVETCISSHKDVSAHLLFTIQEFQLILICVNWSSTYLQSHIEQIWADKSVTMKKASYNYFEPLKMQNINVCTFSKF